MVQRIFVWNLQHFVSFSIPLWKHWKVELNILVSILYRCMVTALPPRLALASGPGHRLHGWERTYSGDNLASTPGGSTTMLASTNIVDWWKTLNFSFIIIHFFYFSISLGFHFQCFKARCNNWHNPLTNSCQNSIAVRFIFFLW